MDGRRLFEMLIYNDIEKDRILYITMSKWKYRMYTLSRGKFKAWDAVRLCEASS